MHANLEFGESPRARYLVHARRGELAYQRDPITGKAIFYPRVAVPGSVDANARPTWHVSQGLGTVYSLTWVTKRESRYNIALIDMDEGFRIMSRIENVEPDDVAIGSRVQVKFVEQEDEPVPVCIPAEGRS